MCKIARLVLIAVASAVSGPAAASDFSTAEEWLSVVKNGDGAAFAQKTAVPFTYATPNKTKRCEGTVKTANALSKWLACFAKAEKLLIDDLKAGDDVRIQEGSGGVDSKELAAAAKKISTPGRWTKAFLNGDGAAFELWILITKAPDGRDTVAAFLLDVDVEEG